MTKRTSDLLSLLVSLSEKSGTTTLNKKAVYATASDELGISNRSIGGVVSALSRKGLVHVNSVTITLTIKDTTDIAE